MLKQIAIAIFGAFIILMFGIFLADILQGAASCPFDNPEVC